MHRNQFDAIRDVLIIQKKPISISEIARQAKISRITAARYLDQMHMSGQVAMYEIGKAKKYCLSSNVTNLSLFDLSSDLIILIDHDFRIIYVNDAYLHFSNLHRDSLIGKRITALNLDIFASTQILSLLKNYQDETIQHSTINIKKNSMDLFFLLTIARINYSSNQAAIAILIKDITKQKRYEEDKFFLADLLSFSNNAIITVNKNHIIQSWNKGAERMFGYMADEIIGKNSNILHPPGYNMKSLIREFMKEKRIHQYESQRVRKDGTIIDVSLTISRVYNNNNEYIGSFVLIEDITEKNMLFEIISAQNIFFEEIFNVINEPILTVDSNMRIIYANRAASTRYNIPTEKLIGMSLRKIYSASLFFRRVNYLQQAWATDKPVRFKDNEGEKNVEIFIYPMKEMDTTNKRWVLLSITIPP